MDIDGKEYCSRCMRPMETEGVCPHCGYEGKSKADCSVLEEGTLLNRRYMLGAVIGQGGFGVTYAAWDENLNRPVAIKEYFPEDSVSRNILVSDDVEYSEKNKAAYVEGLRRFVRESNLLASLQGIPNIVAVLDSFQENNTAYFVMEYIHGKPLDAWVKEKKYKEEQVLRLMRPVMDALVLLHKQGVVHRDLKPDNMLVEDNGTIRLIDFGAAFQMEQRGGTIILSRGYAPLEQYGKEYGRQGPWSDVYGFAAVMYGLLTGTPPEEALLRQQQDHMKSPAALGIRLSKKQNAALMAALSVQPENRTQSMEEFRARLYNERLPEEVIRYKRLILRTISIASSISLLCILALINFTLGFPLGDDIRYSLRGNGFHAVGYSGSQEQLYLPESRIGIPVTQIEDGAFQNASELSFVELPGTVKKIGNLSFANCGNLVGVKLNEGTEEIDSMAFANCEKLQSVAMPYSILSFSSDAFNGSLERLLLIGMLDSHAADMAKEAEIPFAQIEISENDSGMTLRKYETHQSSAQIPDMVEGKRITRIASEKEKTPVFPSQVNSITLPQYLLEIGDYTFYQSKISQIEFPQSLTSIGEYAFSQSFLETLTLPDAVTVLGDAAFATCVRLQSARLSSGLQTVSKGCFEGDKNLTSVEIPEGVTTIEALSFSKCERLSFVRLPKGLKRINNSAFSECVSLDTIDISHTVVYIDPRAFWGCPNQMVISGYADSYAETFAQNHYYEFFNTLVYLQDWDQQIVVSAEGGMIVKEGMKEISEISLPDTFRANPVTVLRDAKYLKSKHIVLPHYLETISNSAFSGNHYLETVVCPEKLREMKSASFANCPHLRQINLPEGLEEIGSITFLSCTALEEIELPSSLRILGDGAFENCTGLKQIRIPSSTVNLGNDVFANSSLTSVTVPGTISMCRTAFYGCKQLEEAVLEEGVRTLLGTFAGCESLKTVVIPSTVTEIHASTFQGCSALQHVWIYARNTEFDYAWNALQHVEYQNETAFQITSLTGDSSEYLFSDSPQVTIHGYRGSTAQLFAMQHGIPFELILEDASDSETSSNAANSYVSSEPIYTEEERLQKLELHEGMTCADYYTRFLYGLGYGMKEYAEQCLELCEETGDQSYQLIAKSARLFLQYSPEYGYTAGDIIVYFEDFKDHPTLLAGDIIVEIDGQRIENSESYSQLKAASGKNEWTYTVLRFDANGCAAKQTVEVSGIDPRPAHITLWPRTFEYQIP